MFQDKLQNLFAFFSDDTPGAGIGSGDFRNKDQLLFTDLSLVEPEAGTLIKKLCGNIVSRRPHGNCHNRDRKKREHFFHCQTIHETPDCFGLIY